MSSSDSLREEFIVCYAPGYPDPYRPHPNTLENAQRFAAERTFNHSTNTPAEPVVKRRLVSDWEEVPRGGVERAEAAASDRRDQAVRTVARVLADWGSRVAVSDRERLATYIVDALPEREGGQA